MPREPDGPGMSPEELLDVANGSLAGWNDAMGLRFVRVSFDEVVAELKISSHHLQPYGVVHGGVYAGIIETTASVGAAFNAMKRGRSAVGLENHTSFLKAVREGVLRVTARPLVRGSRTQVWEATVTDGAGQAVATGRVRMLALEGDAPLAGEKVDVKLPGG
jgi:1,4-dihydroxy-2-naphthoyl-CoA hydrolase